MMMNHSTIAAFMPVDVPFAPYDDNHTMALRYMDRQLIDDVAGESVVDGMGTSAIVYMSDLPSHARVLRPGMQWPHGILLPSDTLLVVVDCDSIIKFVGCLEERRGNMA
ncbi:hypothetical protein IW140_003765 [Coemansia sp. RSA 1813]|nr:hypothetical protein EV178_003519 [Coemansia sp. RSA 1646]KAJ1772795.1 hypothetical protein LPJ74_001134 [Coemansia sp. RSA 1843]KAJ2088661.1 hypothetical protein IW138_004043 [Coemansia sp. RSA 986]KAJ2568559.1 hypothetical protein IW140_003765 [Coemansia sp. RSA 1813]